MSSADGRPSQANEDRVEISFLTASPTLKFAEFPAKCMLLEFLVLWHCLRRILYPVPTRRLSSGFHRGRPSRWVTFHTING